MRSKRLVIVDGIPHERPATRGDCLEGPRPCPWVGCRHHLFLEVNQVTGRIVPDDVSVDRLEAMTDTCSLDVADRDLHTLEAIAAILPGSLTRERVRQIEERAITRAAGTANRLPIPPAQGVKHGGRTGVIYPRRRTYRSRAL